MLILTYFNRIYGPVIFLTSPYHFQEELDEKYLEQIKSLLEPTNQGFFIHNFARDLKTANFGFNLNSPWARGRQETVMISVIISEEEPDYDVYEKILTKFVEDVTSIKDVFKAFYIRSSQEGQEGEINEKYTFLREELNKVHKILSIRKVETEGKLLSFSVLERQKKIDLSIELLHKIKGLTKEKKNCFIVYRTQGKTIKLDIIPTEASKITRMVLIFGEQMTVSALQQITSIFSKYEESLSLIYTSGFCQELDRCIYETYITADADTLMKLKGEIREIPKIISINIENIELQAL